MTGPVFASRTLIELDLVMNGLDVALQGVFVECFVVACLAAEVDPTRLGCHRGWVGDVDILNVFPDADRLISLRDHVGVC